MIVGNMTRLDRPEIAELLSYNPHTGELRWKVNRSNIKEGDPAGYKMSSGYIQVRVLGVLYYAHRLAWLLHYGNWPEDQIDHINHYRGDNRIENLREASRTDNNRNHSLHSTNTSGACGVSWYKDRGKWETYIEVEGKKITLGYFGGFDEAVAARLAANKHYDFHENHGVNL